MSDEKTENNDKDYFCKCLPTEREFYWIDKGVFKYKCTKCQKMAKPDKKPVLTKVIEYNGKPSTYQLIWQFASINGIIEAVYQTDSDKVTKYNGGHDFQSFWLSNFGEIVEFKGRSEWLKFFRDCIETRTVKSTEKEDELDIIAEKIIIELTADKPTDKYKDMINPKEGYIPRVMIPGAVHILSSSIKYLAEREGVKLHELRAKFEDNKWKLGSSLAGYGSHSFRVWVLDARLWTKKGYIEIKAGSKAESAAEAIFHTLQSQKPNTIEKLLLDRSEHQIRIYRSKEHDCNLVARDTIYRLCGEHMADIVEIKRIFMYNEWMSNEPFNMEIDKVPLTVFPFHTKYWDRDEFKHEFEEDETPTEEFIGDDLAPIKPDISKEEKLTKEVKMALMEKVIAGMSDKFHDGVPLKNIMKEVKPIAKTEVMTLINALLDEGMIYCPRDGHWKVI